MKGPALIERAVDPAGLWVGVVLEGRIDNVLRGLFNRARGNSNANIAGSPQGKHLAHDDGHVRLPGEGHVPPATLTVLALDDEVDRTLQLDANIVAVGHAVDFRQEQGRKGVAVHPRSAVGDVPVFLNAAEYEIKGPLHDEPVLAPAWEVAARQKRDSSQARHANVAAGP